MIWSAEDQKRFLPKNFRPRSGCKRQTGCSCGSNTCIFPKLCVKCVPRIPQKSPPPKKCAEILNISIYIYRSSRYEDIPKPPLKMKGFQSSKWSFGRWLSIFKCVSTKELPDIRYTVFLKCFFLKAFSRMVLNRNGWALDHIVNVCLQAKRSYILKPWDVRCIGFFWFHFFRGTESPSPTFQLRKSTQHVFIIQGYSEPRTHNYISEAGNARAWGDGVRYRYMIYVVKILG